MRVYIKPLSMFPKLYSDTIFGAITYAYSVLYPEKIEVYVKDFTSKPPFTLSSAFPFAFNKEEKIRFYPKILNENKSKNGKIENIKSFKKIKYLEEDIFIKLINGSLKEGEIIENYKNYFQIKDLLLESKPEFLLKYNQSIKPNNTINRLDNTSEGIFYSEGLEFKNIGLFFEINFNEKTYQKEIENCIKFLKDRGFGGDISTGKGHFTYEISDENLKVKEDSKYFTNLSRYIPTKEELLEIDENSKYEIVNKRGRNRNGEIRKKVNFFKEGSVFPNNKETYGQIIDSGVKSSCLEYGYAYKIPYKGVNI